MRSKDAKCPTAVNDFCAGWCKLPQNKANARPPVIKGVDHNSEERFRVGMREWERTQ